MVAINASRYQYAVRRELRRRQQTQLRRRPDSPAAVVTGGATIAAVTATATADLPIHCLTFLRMGSSLDPIDLDTAPRTINGHAISQGLGSSKDGNMNHISVATAEVAAVASATMAYFRRVPPSSRFGEGKGGRGEREFTDEDDPMMPHRTMPLTI
ncbi:hypothetical protein EDB92DRAFT_1974593 [Lactarius akahatsu]|uniref:Uncharacterized protein n=1 Tax=Lactarius akahatsu TaxID=416441 RepID=A0AAD4L4Y9_9AGAM|nr:hypothetical protein EDB92DRAFT_1974593 [Lactarius akahatsu]